MALQLRAYAMARCVGALPGMATSCKEQPFTQPHTGICATSLMLATLRSTCAPAILVDWMMTTAYMWAQVPSYPELLSSTYRKQQGEAPSAGAPWQRGSGGADAHPSRPYGSSESLSIVACAGAGAEIAEKGHEEERMGRNHPRRNMMTRRRRLREKTN